MFTTGPHFRRCEARTYSCVLHHDTVSVRRGRISLLGPRRIFVSYDGLKAGRSAGPIAAPATLANYVEYILQLAQSHL